MLELRCLELKLSKGLRVDSYLQECNKAGTAATR